MFSFAQFLHLCIELFKIRTEFLITYIIIIFKVEFLSLQILSSCEGKPY